MFICVFVCVFVCVFCLCVCLCFCLCVWFCVCLCVLFVCLFVCFVCVFVCVFCLCVCLCFCLCVCFCVVVCLGLFACLLGCLFVCLFACLFVQFIYLVSKLLLDKLSPRGFYLWTRIQSHRVENWTKKMSLGGGFKCFFFTPTWGNDPIWWACVSDGWFNHQLGTDALHLAFKFAVSLGNNA